MKRAVLSMVVVSMSFASFAQEQVNENDYLSKKMSFGVEFFNSSNDFTAELAGTSTDVDDDSNGFALQFGVRTGQSNTLTTTFEYRNENFDEGIYDNENNALHYFSVGVLKEFPLENKLSPYIRGSVGLGFMSIDETYYDDDTARALGLKLGAGLAYYPTSSVKIHGGLDWQYRTWTPIDTGTSYGDIEIDETSIIFGAGVSYLF